MLRQLSRVNITTTASSARAVASPETHRCFRNPSHELLLKSARQTLATRLRSGRRRSPPRLSRPLDDLLAALEAR